MYIYLILLLLGFGSNLASSFTSWYSEKFGRQAGTFITILLRDIFGIPVWAGGFVVAVNAGGVLMIGRGIPEKIAAWLFLLAGAAVIIIALLSIRIRAAAPSTGDRLVSNGIYSLVRHPIHCGTFLEFIGIFLFWPSLHVAISCLAGTLWIVIQSKFEESDLKRRIPEYEDYIKNVPAFFPRIHAKTT
ncbi:MAG TPA: methyltransferase [Bacteroidales bacterium]|nr:methyltransferase [Bacteroidales bacterium]